MSNILELHVSCVGLGCDRLTFCEMLHACLVSPCGFGFCHAVCVCVCVRVGSEGLRQKSQVCVLVVVLAFTMGHLWCPSQRLFWQPITAGKGNDPREETEEKSECYTKVSQTRTYTQVIFVLIVFIWKHKPPTFKSFSYLRNISKHLFYFLNLLSHFTHASPCGRFHQEWHKNEQTSKCDDRDVEFFQYVKGWGFGAWLVTEALVSHDAFLGMPTILHCMLFHIAINREQLISQMWGFTVLGSKRSNP